MIFTVCYICSLAILIDRCEVLNITINWVKDDEQAFVHALNQRSKYE